MGSSFLYADYFVVDEFFCLDFGFEFEAFEDVEDGFYFGVG